MGKSNKKEAKEKDQEQKIDLFKRKLIEIDYDNKDQLLILIRLGIEAAETLDEIGYNKKEWVIEEITKRVPFNIIGRNEISNAIDVLFDGIQGRIEVNKDKGFFSTILIYLFSLDCIQCTGARKKSKNDVTNENNENQKNQNARLDAIKEENEEKLEEEEVMEI